MGEAAPSIDAILCSALEIASSDERATYVARACEGDAELQRRVEELIAAHFRAGRFLLDAPGVGSQATTITPRIAEGPGTIIGPYKLLEQIGEGGFGVVFMAEQNAPVRRKVALKIIKPGMDTRQVIARFEAERQALALMDHPNIAKVFDAGATDSGRPFFVMELVRGIPITEFCDQHQFTVGERLELFVSVCHAAQHAHQKGIIHRDIKPSNVLVTLHDDKPVVKVIDFGVAKATSGQLTDKTLFTGFMQMLGTPLYMSPEQTALGGVDVDTRSDIYSLGVLLYELLTGTTPFDRRRLQQAGLDEVGRIIREEEPRKPSTRLSTIGDTLPSVCAHRKIEPRKLTQLLSGDLDWIVMKALEKERTRRYETANGFARDIQRYLADELVEARPPSLGYRMKKAIRRNKVALTTATIVAVALVAGTTVSTWQAIRARDARQLAEARLKAEEAAHAEAVQARQAEAHQRQQAEANLQKAREAVDKYFTTVSESTLLNVPGMLPLRKQLLDSALEYYQGFSQQTDNPVGLADLAVTEFRIVQIMFWNGESPDRYFPHLEKGVEILEQLVREGRDTPEVQRRVAGNLQSNPDVTSWEEDSGRFGPRLLHDVLVRAAKLQEKFARDNPDVAGFRSDLASINHFIAILCNKMNDRSAAVQHAERARILWEQLVKDYPAQPRYRLDLGRLYLDIAMATAGDPAKQAGRRAHEILEQLVAEFPRVPVYRSWLGKLLEIEADHATSPEQAEEAYTQAVSQFEQVVAEFPTATASRTDLARGLLRLADTRARRGNNAEALELYRRSADLFETVAAESPEFRRDSNLLTQVLVKLSARLIAAGRQQEADETSRKARESMPSDAGALNGLAWNLANWQTVQMDEAKWAVELGQKAVELDPQSGSFWNTLGVAQYRAGDWKAALAALEESEKLSSPGNVYNYFFFAMSHWQQGEHDLARKWYTAARLVTDSQNADLARFRAEAAALMGLPEDEPTANTDDAAFGELLVELIPKAFSYRIRGDAFANSEQWERAEDDFSQATELGDPHFSAWYKRALVRCAMGDVPGYQAACAEMVKQFASTEDADTVYFVAWTCALGPDALAEFTPAVAAASRTAKQDASSADYAGNLGAILYRAGRLDEARQKLVEADRLASSANPNLSPPAYNWFFLAMTYQRLGDAEEAKHWFDKARQETDKALEAHAAGTTQLPWNRRLTLKLLRNEAETPLGLQSAPAASVAIAPTNTETPVEATKPTMWSKE